ncbi:cullin, a subunit of E3 ubiquitin ligase [Mycolicibacterium aurum]|uniref:Cullin, a subunit of E3 ubiquitin ligase n=1 Tax=Mycolicibacterium aurum TaxID=1791 RepID=A0A3S4S5A0_MYCAU|nr:DUF559 domain-containing protein [Mycolicibacterium aurum]VEG56712.1 cullin, a subunit of E3 ubiquitin ligase [Mycolicibacterium aurum]
MKHIDSPFRASEQLAAGTLIFRELRRFHEAVHPGVWHPRGAELDAVGRARAAWLWSGREAVVSGLSAAALLGAKWIEPDAPAQLIHANRRPPQGIIVSSDSVADGEVVVIAGMPVTTPARTAFDLGRRLSEREGVQRIDALMNATGLTSDDIESVMRQHPGARGMCRLRRTASLVDGGAESPYESATRLVVVGAGIPAPTTQIAVRDRWGRVFARLDMGWPRWKVAVEYDGAQHWTDGRQRAWDIERAVLLEAAGWVIIRVGADLLRRRSDMIVDRVDTAVRARGGW